VQSVGIQDLPASLHMHLRFRKCRWERRVEMAGGMRMREDLACRRDGGFPAGREGW
jgi:hypothetical protein